MAQIRQVVSEALQAEIRRLLPSQRGFTEDLQASNVITPVIDLTATAEGSVLRADLQSSLAFGSQNTFSISNATTTIVNSTGFWRITGNCLTNFGYTPATIASIIMFNGLTRKTIFDFGITTTSSSQHQIIPFDFTVFLDSGESVYAESDETGIEIRGSYRQIADISGNLINPSGFTVS